MKYQKCRRCGNKLTNGLICLRCGAENENQKEIQEKRTENIKKEEKKKKIKKNNINNFVKAIIIWMIYLAILGIVCFFMQNSFNSCVDKVGHKECGIGILCDYSCMPPFYYTLSLIYSFSITFTVILSPLILFIIIYRKLKYKKSN